MAQTVGSHQQGAIATPANGASIISSVLRGNFTALRTTHNNHDSDGGVHFQSSVAGSKPAAGTAGRKWLETDTLKLFYDTGTVWSEIAYAPTADPTFTGTAAFANLTTSGTIVAAGAVTAATATVTGTLTAATASVSGTATIATVAPTTVSGTPNFSGAPTFSAGATFQTAGKLTTRASASGGAGFNLSPGTAPSSPVNGDVWLTTTGVAARVNGATQNLVSDATVGAGFYAGSAADAQSAAVTEDVWTTVPFRETNTTKGAAPPTLDAAEDTVTINETGWYAVWVRAHVTAGSPTSLGLGILKVSGTGSVSSPADRGPTTFRDHWGGWSDYPTDLSAVIYAEAGATLEIQAFTATAGVSVSLNNYAIVRVA